jgi:hypothetical protein
MSKRGKRIPVGDGYEVIFDQRAQGNESPYWLGRVLRHGKEVGTFRNDGRGGMTHIHPPALVDAFRKLVDEADPVRGPTCFERESLVLVWAEIVGYVKGYFLDNRPVPLAYIVRAFAKDFGQPGSSSRAVPRSESTTAAASGERYRIEARTKAGPITWHPYTSRAEAELALAALEKRAPPGVIKGSWEILPLLTWEALPVGVWKQGRMVRRGFAVGLCVYDGPDKGAAVEAAKRRAARTPGIVIQLAGRLPNDRAVEGLQVWSESDGSVHIGNEWSSTERLRSSLSGGDRRWKFAVLEDDEPVLSLSLPRDPPQPPSRLVRPPS